MKKYLILILSMIVILPCMVLFNGCGPKETGFYVLYNNTKYSEELTMYFDSTDNININSKIQIYALFENNTSKKVANSDYTLTSNLKENVEPGDEYVAEVKYKDFDKITINIIINKLENEVSLAKTSKVYDAESFTTQDLGVSANNEALMSISWFDGEILLDGAPTNAGQYKVNVKIPETKTYKQVDKYFDVSILQAEPDVDWSVIDITNTYLSTDQLVKITLPENFAWKNPNQDLSVGTHSYTVVYTPADKNYKAVEKEIQITAILAFNLPTQGVITYTGEYISLSQETLIGFDENYMVLKDGEDSLMQLNAGNYTSKIGFKSGVLACWADGSTQDRDFAWTISKKKIKVPYYKKNFALMPLEGPLTITWEDESLFDFCYIQDSNATKNTLTFEYPVTTSIRYCLNDTNNLEWEDGTIETKYQHFNVDRDAFASILYQPYGGVKKTITTEELMELKSVCVGSVFEFTLIDQTQFLKIDDTTVKDNRYVVTPEMHKIDIRVFVNDSDSIAIFGVDIPVYFYTTKINIDGEEQYFDLMNNDFIIDLKENQASIEIELGAELVGYKFNLYTTKDESVYEKVSLNNLKFTVENLSSIKYFNIVENKSGCVIAEFYVSSFTRIDYFMAHVVDEDGGYQDEVYYSVGEDSYVDSMIDGFSVVFKKGYENTSYELLDKNGNAFTDFSNLNNKEYFYVVLKNGDEILEKARVYYEFMENFSFSCKVNTIKTQLDYYSAYVQLEDINELNDKVYSLDEEVEIVINNGNPLNITEIGLYRVPISFSYAILDNYTVSYNTFLIINYSASVTNYVEDYTRLNFSSIFNDDGFYIYLTQDNYAGGCGLGNFRALLTDSFCNLSEIETKDGYTLKSVVLLTENNLFGYILTFEKDGVEVTCYIYEAVAGVYDGNLGVSRAEATSFATGVRTLEIIDDTIYANNIKTFEFVNIYPLNDQTIFKLTNQANEVVCAGTLKFGKYVSIYFEAQGTYKLQLIAPNGDSKIYTIIVEGENLSKPLAKITVGDVCLEEKYGKIEDGDYDCFGDFELESTISGLKFTGYLGNDTASLTKTVNGKEYLDVTFVSSIIECFSQDEAGKIKVNEGINTLEVLIDEEEQKFVKLYATLNIDGMDIKIECIMLLKDKIGE